VTSAAVAPTTQQGEDRALAPAQLAWAAALPCALATLAAVVLLGPPLGRALLEPGGIRFWPAAEVVPEPTEHARYLLALLGPPLLAAVVLAGARGRLAAPPAAARLAILAGQLATVGFVLLCLLVQLNVVGRSYDPLRSYPDRLFTPATLIVAGGLTALALLGARRAAVREALARDPRGGRVACALVAFALTALWLSSAFDTDATIGHAQLDNLIPWDMSETFAVLDGRTPLVDFHSQYAQLLPYLSAAIMALLGSSALATWVAIMLALSALGLLAVYAVLRRLVGSPVLALALYAPFLASGFFLIWGTPANRASPAAIFSTWPMRYAGPYALLWLTVRHVDGRAPRRAWALLLAAGLVALNNLEFGAGAFAASVVALACARPPASRRALGRLAGAALAGLGGAALLVALLTLVRAGELPHVAFLLEFPHLYGIGGWFLVPMAPLGFHLVLYVTFAAAIVAAVVRATARREPLLTAALAWSGVFGLIAGSYYVGRSDPLNLIAMLSAWSLALTFLVVLVARSLLTQARRPTAPQVAVLFGFALSACSLAQVPLPWAQLERLRHATPRPLYEQPAARAFVAGTSARGERVAILIPLGHRIAYETGRVNVAPYSGMEAMPTPDQLARTIDVLRAQHATSLYISYQTTLAEKLAALRAAGFVPAESAREAGDVEYVRLVDSAGGGG
jgi:hypothetical protein